jgi:hypothetical protein
MVAAKWLFHPVYYPNGMNVTKAHVATRMEWIAKNGTFVD